MRPTPYCSCFDAGVLVWHTGDCLDFQQKIRTCQRLHLHQSAGWGRLSIDVHVTHLAQYRQVGSVQHVEIQLYHVGKIGFDGGESHADIVEDLHRLSAKVTAPDQRICGIESDLPSQIDRPPSTYLYHVGIAGR